MQSSQVATESNAKPSMGKTEDRGGDVKYSSHSLDEVAGMIRSTISAYEVKVNILSCILYEKKYTSSNIVSGLNLFQKILFA